MLRFLAAIAVVLAVLTAGALIVGAAASRLAPLAARLEAWWSRRATPIGTTGRRDEQAAGSAVGDPALLAAMQSDDSAADGGAGGLGDGGGFGDGGGGAASGDGG